MQLNLSMLMAHIVQRLGHYSDMEILNSLQDFNKSYIDSPYETWTPIFTLCYKHNLPHTLMFLRHFHYQPPLYEQWYKTYLRQQHPHTIQHLTLCFTYAELHDWLADNFSWTLLFDICSARNLFMMTEKHSEYEDLLGVPRKSIEFLHKFVRAGMYNEQIDLEEWDEPFSLLFPLLAFTSGTVEQSNWRSIISLLDIPPDNDGHFEECEIIV